VSAGNVLSTIKNFFGFVSPGATPAPAAPGALSRAPGTATVVQKPLPDNPSDSAAPLEAPLEASAAAAYASLAALSEEKAAIPAESATPSLSDENQIAQSLASQFLEQQEIRSLKDRVVTSTILIIF
jgi:hypothetical protein